MSGILKLMTGSGMHCKFGCEHERHQKYISIFDGEMFEQKLLWNIAMYVWDKDLSPDDGDDLELWQDMVFDTKFGRLHIYFYEHYLFKSYYHLNPDWVTTIFSRYLIYLDKASPLFTNDAFDFLYKRGDYKLILEMLKKTPYDIRMRFVKHAEKYPTVLQSVPKLRLYNLFS